MRVMLIRIFLEIDLRLMPIAYGAWWTGDLGTKFRLYIDASNRETGFGTRFGLSGPTLIQLSESANLASSFCNFFLISAGVFFGLRLITFFAEPILGLYPPCSRKVCTIPTVAPSSWIVPFLYLFRYLRNFRSIWSAADEFDDTTDEFWTAWDVLMVTCVTWWWLKIKHFSRSHRRSTNL